LRVETGLKFVVVISASSDRGRVSGMEVDIVDIMKGIRRVFLNE